MRGKREKSKRKGIKKENIRKSREGRRGEKKEERRPYEK